MCTEKGTASVQKAKRSMSCDVPLTTSVKKQNALSKLEECMRNLEGARLAERVQDGGMVKEEAAQELPAVSVDDQRPSTSQPLTVRGKPEQATAVELTAKTNEETDPGSKGRLLLLSNIKHFLTA